MSVILITEDNQNLLQLYKKCLTDAGFDVRLSKNGREAVEIMDAEPIDVLLLDLLTPQMNGFGVLDHVKTKGYAFPVIVLTNLDEGIDKKKCLDMGASDFLVKGDIDLPDIVAKVRSLI